MFKKSEMKSLLKKSAALLLASAVVLSGIPAQSANAATAVKSITVSAKDKKTVLTKGKTYQLSVAYKPTGAKEKVTYTTSNKKVATVSAKGNVKAIKSGSVKITAKTASGKSASANFLVVDANGTVSTQTNLNKMLAAKNVKKITIKSAKEATYTIKKGTYTGKALVVNAPLADVTNNGNFKAITIQDVKNGTWKEVGKNNSFKITDKEFSFIADAKAVVKNIVVSAKNAIANFEVKGKVTAFSTTGANAHVTLNTAVGSSVGTIKIEGDGTEFAGQINGAADKIVIDSKSDVLITGTADMIHVEVTKEAEGAKIETAVPVEIVSAAKVEIVVDKGAEGTTIEKADSNVKLDVTNNSSTKVEVGVVGSDAKEVIDAAPVSSGGGGGSSDSGNNTPSNPVTETVSGTDSGNFVLTKSLSQVSSIAVKIDTTKNGSFGSVTPKTVNSTMLGVLKLYLDRDPLLQSSWDNITSKTITGGPTGDVSISSTGTANKKIVTDNTAISYEVTVNCTAGTVSIKKDGSSITYTLSKSGDNTLSITASDGSKANKLVQFVVTY